MANSATHFYLPWPIRKARYTIEVPYLDADGDPTDPTTPDTEISKDGGTFADCAEEVTTVTGSNGVGYLTLTGAEMDCGSVVPVAKVASGPKNTICPPIRPVDFPVVASGTASAGGNSTITLAASAEIHVGRVVRTTGGTGGGGTGGANNQARLIVSASGNVATISGTWETNPSSDTTYEILATPLNPVVASASVTQWNGTAVATPATAGYPVVTIKSGTGTGELSLSSGVVKANDSAGNAVATAQGITDIKGSGFNATTDTLEKIRDAVDTIGASVGSATYYNPSGATRVVGTDQGGTYTNMGAHDDSSYATGEVVGTGLEVTVDFTTDQTENPNTLEIEGYYDGGSGHNVGVYGWNYQSSAWELLLTMLTRSTAFSYAVGLALHHHDATTGAMKLRFLHNVTTYISAHRLYLDFIRIGKTADVDPLAQMVSDIKAKTDQLSFNQNGPEFAVKADVVQWDETAVVLDSGLPSVHVTSGTTLVEVERVQVTDRLGGRTTNGRST